MCRRTRGQLGLWLISICFLTLGSGAAHVDPPKVRDVVGKTVLPLMQKYKVPGMAVAVVFQGTAHFYNYGVASRKTRQPITRKTLFEIGSLSKTFTAALASYAQVNGSLSLSDRVSKYFPSLRGSAFDRIRLLNLGTHTAGDLPLQVPDDIRTTNQLMGYLAHWQPAHAIGTHRTYSNIGTGIFGLIAARSLHEPFEDALEGRLFPALGMMHSYIQVPPSQRKKYAQGYTVQDAPIRMKAGVLASEAYGVKSDTTDMVRFLQANMGEIKLDEKWRRAIRDTHTGYFKAGPLVQDLIWEQYPSSAGLQQVLAGNSAAMLSEEMGATVPLSPPQQPQADALINKTGSTNGFAAYEAFLPAKRLGIVILANKNYPIAARVTAAYRILTQLGSQRASKN